MFDRETTFRLSIAAVIAVLLHLLLLPSLAARFISPGERLAKLDEPVKPDDPVKAKQPEPLSLAPEERQPEPEREEITLGQDESPLKSSVAWISHEDFQELMARKSPTHQPALQSEVDPLPDAPMVVDPTPPAVVVPEASAAQVQQEAQPEVEPSQAVEVSTPAPQPEAQPADQVAAEAPREMPDAEPVEQLAALPPRVINALPADLGVPDSPGAPELAPIPQVDAKGPQPSPQTPTEQVEAHSPEQVQATPTEQQPVEAPRDQQEPQPQPAQPAQEEQRPAPEAQPTQANPTAAPRSQADAPPTTLEDDDKVQPGGVVTAQGIRIITAKPIFSVVTLASTIPRNPVVRVTFNPKGEVTKAELLRSSGFSNVDGPVLASLYKWRAEGVHLERVQDEFSKTIEILLISD